MKPRRSHARYRQKFGESVPDHVWQRHAAELLPHVERAIRENRPLTDADLRLVQGFGPERDDVVY